MLLGTKTVDCITDVSRGYIENSFGSKENLLLCVSSVSILSVSGEYILLKNKLISLGYDLSELSYIQIFQVITEVLLLHYTARDLPEGSAALASINDIFMEMTHTELHNPRLVDCLAEVGSAVSELVINLSTIYTVDYINQFVKPITGATTYIPLKWQYSPTGIYLELGGCFDA